MSRRTSGSRPPLRQSASGHDRSGEAYIRSPAGSPLGRGHAETPRRGCGHDATLGQPHAGRTDIRPEHGAPEGAARARRWPARRRTEAVGHPQQLRYSDHSHSGSSCWAAKAEAARQRSAKLMSKASGSASHRLGEGPVMFEASGRPLLTASTTPTLPITSAVAAATEVTLTLVTTVTVPTPRNGG